MAAASFPVRPNMNSMVDSWKPGSISKALVAHSTLSVSGETVIVAVHLVSELCKLTVMSPNTVKVS